MSVCVSLIRFLLCASVEHCVLGAPHLSHSLPLHLKASGDGIQLGERKLSFNHMRLRSDIVETLLSLFLDNCKISFVNKYKPERVL